MPFLSNFLKGAGEFGRGGQQPGFEGLLNNPLLAIGLQLLNQDQSPAQALANALKSTQESALHSRRLTRENEKTKRIEAREAKTRGEEETRKKIFGGNFPDAELSKQLIASGIPDLVTMGIKLRPKEAEAPNLQTFPIGENRVTGFFDPNVPPSRESFNPVFESPRTIARPPAPPRAAAAPRPRRETQSEKIAKELSGIDYNALTPEQKRAKIAEIGAKTGSISLLKQSLSETAPKETPKNTLNSDMILYNKLFPGGINRITGDVGISEREFTARADLLRRAQKDRPDKKVSEHEKLSFFTGDADEFSQILNSFYPIAETAPSTSSAGPAVESTTKLTPEQRDAFKKFLANPKIEESRKAFVRKQLGDRL